MSLKPDDNLIISLFAIIAVVLLGINNARLVKKGKVLNQIYGLLPVVATAVFHIAWWQQASNVLENVLIYIIGSVATTAFLFGTAFMTTGCLTLKDDKLCINADNKVFKLFKRMPINFEGKSICSISWCAALCIFCMPIFMLIVSVFAFAASILICSITWQNPIKYFLEIINLGGWPYTEMQTSKKTYLPVSPIFWLTIVLLIGWAVSAAILNMSAVLVTVKQALAFVAVISVAWYALLLLSNKFVGKWESLDEEQKEKTDWELNQAYRDLVYKSHARPILIWGVFWQVFRQKYCPKIQYCCTDEMGNNDCDEETP
jgi:hypothetical protein